MSHTFRIQGDCTPEQLYRFLYEFYWTGYLHRIDSMNIQTRENSNLLDATLLIRGLTMAKINMGQPYPSNDNLPGPKSYFRQLASGPWKSYSPMAKKMSFRFSRPGIDDSDWTILSAIPETQTADGKITINTRWNVQTTGKTLVVPVGGTLSVGTFSGTVEEVVDDMVILRQSNGFRWILNLGDRLSEAACIPDGF